MATVDHCPSCGADASHRQVDFENESTIYCFNCGHVLDDTDYQPEFVHHISRPAVNGQTDVATMKRRYPFKVFHVSQYTLI
jgi:uncharacterized Zn finger protein